jgi:hypothetical protein
VGNTLDDLEGGLVSRVDFLGAFNLCMKSFSDTLRDGSAIDLCSRHGV